MSKAVAIARGRRSKKFVDYGRGGRFMVTPCVGTDSMGQLGVGFYMRAGKKRIGWVWGLVSPRHLIQAWRAMKMIEQIPAISLSRGTLCHCWSVSREWLGGYDDRYLYHLGALFKTQDEFTVLRAKVLSMFPTRAELRKMLKIVKKYNLDVSMEEIEQERKRRKDGFKKILARLRTDEEARIDKAYAEAMQENAKYILRSEVQAGIPAATQPKKRWWRRIIDRLAA